jgi:hypothetical protein
VLAEFAEEFEEAVKANIESSNSEVSDREFSVDVDCFIITEPAVALPELLVEIPALLRLLACATFRFRKRSKVGFLGA